MFDNFESGYPVFNLSDFKKKYGTKTFGLVIGEFIKRAPSFRGDDALAAEIGEMLVDLETALTHEQS